MNSPLFRKLLLSFLAILMIGFILVALFSNLLLQRFLMDDKTEALYKQGESLLELLNESTRDASQLTQFEKTEAELRKSQGIRVDLLLTDGLGTDKFWKNAKRLLKKGEIQDPTFLDKILNGQRVRNIGSFKAQDEQKLLTVGLPVLESGKVIGALFLNMPVQEIQTDPITKIVYLTALLIAFPAGLVIWYVSRKITGPLVRMNDVARHYGTGNFQDRIIIESKDEVGQLAATFNQMADQLGQLDTLRKDLVANVSHELRTPLTSVRGLIQGLSEGVIPQEQSGRYLNMIHLELNRLITLLNTMLDLSAIESGKVVIQPQVIRWSSLVETVKDSVILRMEEKDIAFITKEPGDVLLKVYGDPERLKQILFNLLDNAIRHTPAEGKITIESSELKGYLQVKVRDTGAGIAPEKLSYIWERFYTEDASRQWSKERSGLGLTITKSLVELMRGRITVESTLGVGTTFTLLLPMPPK